MGANTPEHAANPSTPPNRPVHAGGDAFGTHRAVEPAGGLPQPARRVDNDFTRLFSGELLLAVETLNIDAASFRQMEEAAAAAGDPSDEAVSARVLKTVAERGKQHNPVTGSGGMLLGRVLQVCDGHPDAGSLEVGARVATLVSLSLTPLTIDRVHAVRRASAQLDVAGEAVLFASGAYARLPSDLSERLALAVLDVAGAAPQVARLVSPGQTVLVLGAGGKSGVLCAAEAKRCGAKRVLGVESHAPYADDLRRLGLCDEVLAADARESGRHSRGCAPRKRRGRGRRELLVRQRRGRRARGDLVHARPRGRLLLRHVDELHEGRAWRRGRRKGC